MENKLELSQDQINAIIEVCNRVVRAVIETWEKIKDALIRMANQLYEEFLKPIIRHLFLLQLLEWKAPFWLARILQKVTPWFGIHKIGLKYWQKRFA